MLAGVLFGVADLAEKMLTNNIYGSALGDYGLAWATSLPPGVILSDAAGRALPRLPPGGQTAHRRVRPPPGALLPATGDPKMMELIAGALGGAIKARLPTLPPSL